MTRSSSMLSGCSSGWKNVAWYISNEDDDGEDFTETYGYSIRWQGTFGLLNCQIRSTSMLPICLLSRFYWFIKINKWWVLTNWCKHPRHDANSMLLTYKIVCSAVILPPDQGSCGLLSLERLHGKVVTPVCGIFWSYYHLSPMVS